jgi:putative restriction endonuclease
MRVRKMDKDLSYYIHCFTHLKRDKKNGGAPHKPILLLSIIRLFEKEIFTGNQISVLPELVAAFKSNWTKLVVTNHFSIFALPFYHMNSEPFWKLIPNIGCEKWIESKSSMRSFGNLTTAIKYALIDTELSNLLMTAVNREVLKISLLDKYFPDTKSNFGTNGGGDDFPSKELLHDNSETYKQKIIELKNKVDENTFQEEIFIRSGLFKREIPKIYNHTCAISGLRISAVVNVSMIDACHIVPFSEGYDDTLTNGISLCPNLHRAFDRGLISISDDFTILINKNFVENKKSTFNLSQFAGQQIFLPYAEELYPDLRNIAAHRKKYGFA